MDVQAAAATAIIFPPLPAPSGPAKPSSDAVAGAGVPAVSLAASVPVISGSDAGSNADGGASGNGSTIGATPGLATLPAGPPAGTKKGAETDTIGAGVAKFYNAQQQNVSVSFQIEQNPNEIVTVFTDKETGKVIVQFPSETLIALAKFFDKLDGGVVNKKV